ncbi:monocarboxylate transporter 12 isoform X2 [Augochlora pura]
MGMGRPNIRPGRQLPNPRNSEVIRRPFCRVPPRLQSFFHCCLVDASVMLFLVQFLSYGLMVGIGAGLTFPPTVYIVTAYFEKLRGFANGLCISGSAIGTIVLPPFLQYLLDCFGYRGAVLIMGAITLNTLVCGLLYHPVEEHMIAVPVEEGIDNDALSIDEPLDKKKETVLSVDNETQSSDDKTLKEEEKLEDEDSQTASDSKETDCSGYKDESSLDDKEKEIEKEDTCNSSDKDLTKEKGSVLNYENASVLRRGSTKSESNVTDNKNGSSEMMRYSLSKSKDEKVLESPKKSLGELSEKSVSKVEEPEKSHFFDLSVLRDPIYLVILISNTTSAISNTNFMILLPSYAISQGFDKNSSALLLSVVSVFDLVGRISGASLSDINFVPKYYYFVGGLGTSGLALALLPMATSYVMLSFFCGLFGLSSGMYIGITTVILADMLGTEKLSSSYGISLFVNGVLQLVGPPACGAIFESVGSYKPIFLAFGIILILGTALWAVVPLINRKNKKDIQSV